MYKSFCRNHMRRYTNAMRPTVFLYCVAICWTFAEFQSVNANLITNGSFENLTGFVDNHPDQDTDCLASGSTALAGWTTFGANLAWIGPNNSYDVTAQDGKYSLDLTGYYHAKVYAGIEQNISTIVGQEYQLSYYLGGDYGTTGIKATAGETTQTSTHLFQASGWFQEVMTFTATSTTTTISLVGTQACSNDKYLGLDNVSVTEYSPLTAGAPPIPGASVPEPSSFVLLGFGCLAIGVFRRRSSYVLS